jgi:ketosteroid isomerase-like protein
MASPTAPRSATTPQDLHSIFKELLEAGDLDGLLTIYEQDAILVAGPDQLATGHAPIRDGLAPFVAMQAKIIFGSQAVAYAGDIALVHARWSGTGPRRRARLSSAA